MADLMVLPPPRYPVARAGHAATPGTGPEGETCGTCAHLRAPAAPRRGQHARRGEVRPPGRAHTRSPATDVRLKHPACRAWSAAGGGAA